ncbi:MAG: putative porin [Gammaproteobacteria bacterium]|nr:putative porin [Gammaproteobacteria bacterium]
MNAKKWRVASFLCILVCINAWSAEKDQATNVDPTTLKLIKLLVEQGVLTQDKANALLREAGKPDAATSDVPKTEPGIVRVPYVPETIKNEMREQIKQEVLAQAKQERWGAPGALPEWIERIKWDGDIRLRYQRDQFPDGNLGATPNYQAINSAGGIAQAGTNVFINDSVDRTRWRLRARLGMLAKVNDELETGLRLTTGNTVDPVSTNQTLGNNFNRNSFVLDRAYLRFDPNERFTLWGGRLPNPWFGTDLVWDEDLNFDGVAATFKPKLSDNISGFATLGWFPVQEVELSASDKSLSGAQVGMDWKISAHHGLKIGLAYYDYRHVSGRQADSALLDYTAPQFVQKGNSMFHIRTDTVFSNGLFGLAPNFKEIDLTAVWDIAAFDPVHVVFTGDYVKNVGFDRAEIQQRTGLDIEPKTRGYQMKFAVGSPLIKKRGDWQFISAYKYLERDAVLDAFTDSDFHLGGTDAKGWILGGGYGLANNTWLSLRWLSANEIDGPPLAIDVLQLDLNARF